MSASTNEILIARAAVSIDDAAKALREAWELGKLRPVPADVFTKAFSSLRTAQAAVTELERRARGGEPVKED